MAETDDTKGTPVTKPKHERTRDIQKSLETRAKAPLQHFDSRRYVQHNVNLGDGLGPILELMDALPADRTRVEPLRSFEDGDYSVAHLDYELGDWGPMVGFEVHRWEDDRIVEHWDNLQATPANSNPSGRSMIDGATEVVDPDRTDANKELVRAFTETVLIGGDLASIGDFHDGTALIQHDPLIGDGTAALSKRLRGGLEGTAGPVYHALRLLFGQGSFVLAACEGELVEEGVRRPAAFYDLYRLSGGVVVEHWDVVEIIPPREQWQNDNGKF